MANILFDIFLQSRGIEQELYFDFSPFNAVTVDLCVTVPAIFKIPFPINIIGTYFFSAITILVCIIQNIFISVESWRIF